MAAPNAFATVTGGQGLLSTGVVEYLLETGERGIIAPEEKRTFDHIIDTLVGRFPSDGLEDEQVSHILRRSELPPSDIESIWELTTTIDAEPLPDDRWTQLQVYVALRNVQIRENLTLNAMAFQFAGSVPPETKKRIVRRTSYAQAGISLSTPTKDRATPPPSHHGITRNQSMLSAPNSTEITSFRRTTSDATTTSRLASIRVDRAVANHDDASVSQAGLESLEIIQEIPDFRKPAPIIQEIPEFRNHASITEEIAEFRDQAPIFQEIPAFRNYAPIVEEIPEFRNHAPIHSPITPHQDATYSTGFHQSTETESVQRQSSIKTDNAGRAQRLENLFRDRLPRVSKGPAMERAELVQRTASIPDRSEAREILVRNRHSGPKSAGLGKLIKSKQAKQMGKDEHTWTFDQAELSLALKEAVENGRVGAARALVGMGASANFYKEAPKGKLKSLRTGHFTSTPSNYLQIAASRNDVDMVSLLASLRPSPRSLVDALDHAVKNNLSNLISVLLQHGADPNSLGGSVFATAITSQKPALVRLLLRAHIKVTIDILTRNLPVAVSHGQEDIVSLLVVYEADICFENFSALRKAVQNQRIDLVLAIMKGDAKSEAASSVIGEAFSDSSSLAVPEQYLLIEILLCAGAKGDNVARMLIDVVRAGHRSIAKLIVMHGVDLQYNNAEALRTAVRASNVELLETLLLGNIAKECASSLFEDIPQSCSNARMCKLMLLLISKGATGTPLDKGLVQAVQRSSTKLVGLLLDHKASVDYMDAQALQMAVSGGHLAISNMLLSKGRPQPSTLPKILRLVPKSPAELRYHMTKSILDTAGHNGIPAMVLDTALIDAMDPRSQAVDNGLVAILIAAGSNVDYQQGKCFQMAAEGESIELLEMLIEHMSKPTSLCGAVSVAMNIKERKARRKFISLLLEYGAKGPKVDQALNDALIEDPIDEDLFVSLLNKADVGYRGGQTLSTSVKHSATKEVASILQTGKTDPKSRVAALFVLLDPHTSDRQAKLELLLEAGIDQEGLDKALVKEINGERSENVIKMLVEKKASCDYDGGKALELAIASSDNRLLEYLVSSKPDPLILGRMIPIAMGKDRTSKRISIDILLRADARGDQISHALVQEVCGSHNHDPQLVDLLLQYGAAMDYSNGAAIKHVVTKPLDVDLLKVLVRGNRSLPVLLSLVPLAMAHNQPVRDPLLQVLLEGGARGPKVHVALIAAASQGPAAQKTIDLLLKHEASVNFRKCEAIKAASKAGFYTILDCLLKRDPDPEHLPDALKLAMDAPASQSGQNLRFQCVQLLTEAGVTDQEVIHSALIRAVQDTDHALVKLLIKCGGDPNFENGSSVIAATRQCDVVSLELLAKLKPTSTVCSDAFAITTQNGSQWQHDPKDVLQIHGILLDGGATGPAVDQAFLNKIMTSNPLADRFISKIMACQTPLDVNFSSGKSLHIAVKKVQFPVIAYLLIQHPTEKILSAAFMTIFELNTHEDDLIKMVFMFFEYSKKFKKHIYFGRGDPLHDPLYQILHRHGDKPDLLEALLKSGCGANSRFSWIFQPEIGNEEVSPLLWLLCQGDDGLNPRTVRILLDHGADVNFRTSDSGTNPLIAAASSLRPQIVSQLLQAGAEPETQDKFGGTPLYHATRAGKLENMDLLLKKNVDPNDESLHVAAKTLNASAVKLLLDRGATIDEPGTLFHGSQTPLGTICRSVDPQTRDPAELKKTFKEIREAKPDLQKVTDGKSVIILALDNKSPLLMIRTLLLAFPTLQKSLNEDYNIYSTKGLFYSPTMYVRHFKCEENFEFRSFVGESQCCTRSTCPAPDLEKLLRGRGCRDRFWDENAGANQPFGACGLPDAIVALQKEAARLREEEAKNERIRAEAKAREEAAQAKREAEEEAELKREQKRFELLEKKREADERAADARQKAELRILRERSAIRDAERAAETRAEKDRLQAQADHQTKLLAAEEARYRAEKTRSDKEYHEHFNRVQATADEEESRERRKSELKAKHLREEAKIKNAQFEKKKQILDKQTGLLKQWEYSSMSRNPVGPGRIMEEIEY